MRDLLDHLGGFYAPYSTPERPRPYPTDELIEMVALTEHRRAKVATLSGGQRRRLDVAIGIVGRPELLFLDEPTAGFDPTARRDFHDLVHRLSDLQDTAVLLTTHDLDEAEKLADTHVSVALFMLPGLLALQIVFSGAYGMATQLATEREDGTLLRLKSIPGGMTGYVVGQMLRTTLEIAFSMVIVLVPAFFFIPGLTANGVTGWMEALGFLLLGLLAVLPLGFVTGSVFKSPRMVGGWGMLVMGGIIWVSGIFYPLAQMAGWAQMLGQLTPTYWLGLGLRSALLPEAAAAVEIDGSWRTLLTVVILLAWAVVGFLAAPPLLRRMARRESGSSVAARREKALQRV